ncbi:TRAP transporter small permease subunit [Sulfitobacter sp. D35]|uniref:TRAP transporter small permease n=1 Tax=Sulfitobacter sp. D35 TaxID=3083252 RepID=UPI00296EA247|nr:TRAP transporter small permease subunit [Sulfitobacter sp. D35]MDW4498896.1 TRAP transporter small permease subunit [Sulfitobacter sp. D35]
MGGLLSVLAPIGFVNETLLRIGRAVGALAVALMVLAILIQIFFRYVLNNALPWPDEAARFCMLWMTGLMAPTAFRRGGFVAIEMLGRFLPRAAGQILNLMLLSLSLIVLIVGVQLGWEEITGFGGRFATASLYLPMSLDFESWLRVPRSWMMASLFVGVLLLLMVNIELILRSLITLLGGGDRLPEIPEAAAQPGVE